MHFQFLAKRLLLIVFTITLGVFGSNSSHGQTAVYNERYTIQGFSQPIRFTALSGATFGVVSSRVAVEGEWVRAGECLVELDHRVHDEKLDQSRIAKDSLGDLQITEAELAAAESRHIRLAELTARNHASTVELLQAKETLEVARGNVQRVKDRLSQQEADYRRLMAEREQFFIRAPFDGVIVEYKKNIGEYVGPGDSVVCTIADTAQLSVEFLVPRIHRANLKVGAEVSVVFTVANQIQAGTITYVSPFPNGETSTYKVKVRVDNADGKLTAGERCLLQSEQQSPSQTSDDLGDQLTQRSK